MLIASKLIPGGAGLAAVLVRRAATVELDWGTRQKSRFDATDSHGRAVGVFLLRGSSLRGGDVLVADDGSLVAVKALAQPVLHVRVGAKGTPLDLLRAAYHLGNRHVPLEIKPDHLQLEPDHVLAEMLRRMGLLVEAREAPFEPEAGAYDAASVGHAAPASHGQVPAGGHGHDRGHAHGLDDAHGQVHAHGHVHTDACDHAHGHEPARGAVAAHDDHGHPHGHGHSHGDHGHSDGDHDHDHEGTPSPTRRSP